MLGMVFESFCQFDVNFTQSQFYWRWMKKISAMKRRVPKNTQTLQELMINPHPNTSITSLTQLQHPDPNKTYTINTVPYKQSDSAINVCTLNIRSLTIKEDRIKLKRLFKLEVCMDGSDFHKLCQYWREQISRYQIWTTGTKYRSIMILI